MLFRSEYKTKYDVKIDFTMPEFSSSRIIRHRFHVDQSKDRQNLGYDVILGRDIMIKLGLATDFARRKLVWDQMSIPMWTVSERDNKSNPILHKEELRQFVQQTAEPKVTQNATKSPPADLHDRCFLKGVAADDGGADLTGDGDQGNKIGRAHV